MDISVVLPVLNEGGNLGDLLQRLRKILEGHGLKYEFLVVDGGSRDNTREVAAAQGAVILDEDFPGYAGALRTGFRHAQGEYVLTLDADLSHEPAFVAKMWRARHLADIVIASRYVRGGVAYTSIGRRALSRLLNVVLRRMLSVPVRDLSSGYRLYRREVLEQVEIGGRNFEVLEEILVKAYTAGFSITEVPFTYFPRHRGVSHARLLRFGMDLANSSFKLWKLRNSLESADYDARAFYSLIPPQRYWQRARHHIVTSWARGTGLTLDAGCGSSIIIQSLNDAIALDYNFAKTRYLHRLQIPALRASAFALPFKDEIFDCVVSSQVIEHIPREQVLFDEMWRVLRPGGMLIIGTPDYATWQWRTIEPLYGMLMPWAYRDEHISHYTREELSGILERMGFVHEETAYVAHAELIMRYRKPLVMQLGAQRPAMALEAKQA
ncbi:MAG TPA: glycosyltransferase [Candidatus Binataceae bacterium]|jgi:dolichol-phosphate mannosyltransferase|nr:glycosyltransferase [Candidatus Binataceae bacterium]